MNINDFDNASIYEGESESVLSTLKLAPNVLIADPPRSCLSPVVQDAITNRPLEQITNISCNPTTFARNLKKITRIGYRLVSAVPFDLFL